MGFAIRVVLGAVLLHWALDAVHLPDLDSTAVRVAFVIAMVVLLPLRWADQRSDRRAAALADRRR